MLFEGTVVELKDYYIGRAGREGNIFILICKLKVFLVLTPSYQVDR